MIFRILRYIYSTKIKTPSSKNMSKWESEKEELERLINTEKVSYEEIGRRYGCSGANIKKVAKQLGIEIPQRRKINPCETFNKGTGKKYYCLNCGKELNISNVNNRSHKFCSNKCQSEYTYKQYIQKWLNGEEVENKGAKNGRKGEKQISVYIKKYLYEKYNGCCQLCGWNKIHPILKYAPLQVHHIDGNAFNNSPNNLQLLCPNCHALTENYSGLNRGKGRDSRIIKENL